jgi:hypothetical protein
LDEVDEPGTGERGAAPGLVEVVGGEDGIEDAAGDEDRPHRDDESEGNQVERQAEQGMAGFDDGEVEAFGETAAVPAAEGERGEGGIGVP